MEKWKYVSENTTDAICLHDCECIRICYKDNRIIMEMEWMEIMEFHPHNNFLEAHQSGKGIIELIEPQIIKCTYEKAGAKESIKDLTLIELEELDFLNFKEEKDDYGFINKMFLIKSSNKGNYDNVCLELRYKSSIVKFNELQDVSWFV